MAAIGGYAVCLQPWKGVNIVAPGDARGKGIILFCALEGHLNNNWNDGAFIL